MTHGPHGQSSVATNRGVENPSCPPESTRPNPSPSLFLGRLDLGDKHSSPTTTPPESCVHSSSCLAVKRCWLWCLRLGHPSPPDAVPRLPPSSQQVPAARRLAAA
ncbi:hypothetical protein PVAP13_6NG148903 [Panicum virgatum]|uniref:Uncharacterized protein n=1 Tax=Panicum virgatum TaxID=38727 RepID=A0A8T0R0W3_PANVG|nr:hypothetical protein PVAP13_6NG148903 [Panicum virgatum]